MARVTEEHRATMRDDLAAVQATLAAKNPKLGDVVACLATVVAYLRAMVGGDDAT